MGKKAKVSKHRKEEAVSASVKVAEVHGGSPDGSLEVKESRTTGEIAVAKNHGSSSKLKSKISKKFKKNKKADVEMVNYADKEIANGEGGKHKKAKECQVVENVKAHEVEANLSDTRNELVNKKERQRKSIDSDIIEAGSKDCSLDIARPKKSKKHRKSNDCRDGNTEGDPGIVDVDITFSAGTGNINTKTKSRRKSVDSEDVNDGSASFGMDHIDRKKSKKRKKSSDQEIIDVGKSARGSEGSASKIQEKRLKSIDSEVENSKSPDEKYTSSKKLKKRHKSIGSNSSEGIKKPSGSKDDKLKEVEDERIGEIESQLKPEDLSKPNQVDGDNSGFDVETQSNHDLSDKKKKKKKKKEKTEKVKPKAETNTTLQVPGDSESKFTEPSGKDKDASPSVTTNVNIAVHSAEMNKFGTGNIAQQGKKDNATYGTFLPFADLVQNCEGKTNQKHLEGSDVMKQGNGRFLGNNKRSISFDSVKQEPVHGFSNSHQSQSVEKLKRRRSDNSEPHQPFKRVREDSVVFHHDQLRDNSFYSKRDTYGERAFNDLAPTRGKGFRKEKTKKKRLSHHGGKLGNTVNSYKFPDESD